jgi:hypothetical protein
VWTRICTTDPQRSLSHAGIRTSTIWSIFCLGKGLFHHWIDLKWTEPSRFDDRSSLDQIT